MKRLCMMLAALLLAVLAVGCAGSEDSGEQNMQEGENENVFVYEYVSKDVKEDWRQPLIDLISNQADRYTEELPRPNEPGIVYGVNMGLFDINIDGIPELFVNLGGGSAGNDCYVVYDIMTGQIVSECLDGSGDFSWSVFYNQNEKCYLPIAQCDFRGGAMGVYKQVMTAEKDAETAKYVTKTLFSASYCFKEVYLEDGSIDLEPEMVSFFYDDGKGDFQGYQYAITSFYQKNCLVPHTGMILYSWDRDEMDAFDFVEQMLFAGGQEFVIGQ